MSAETASSGVSSDAVDIATSTPARHLLAIAAMEAGLLVVVENPMGLTLAACSFSIGVTFSLWIGDEIASPTPNVPSEGGQTSTGASTRL